MKDSLLADLRNGKRLTLRQQIIMIAQLSVPGILAQISSIIMQYIDASMVGRLSSKDSASIGLVSSSTWLLGGLCMAVSTGFTVQVAHYIGAGEEKKARQIVKQGLITALGFGAVLLVIAVSISGILPVWLGGTPDICRGASMYFMVYGFAIPVMQLNSITGGMIQCSGNMKLPSILHVVMCGLDVICNAVLIFPSGYIQIGSSKLFVPGFNLGVMGAALGTALAEVIIVCIMLYYLLFKSPSLHMRRDEKLRFSKDDLKKAFKIALPVGVEQTVMCGAQVATTRIVSPLGSIAIAANSFAVTAESLCYMPGYGIGSAATTLIGQSTGAKRHDMTKKLGWLTTFFGMLIMAVSGTLMYIFAPVMIGILSPDPEIRELGTAILRIEAFAEPMFAASIVASGVFRGAGDTLIPCIMNFVSMWMVRIPLSALLAPKFGLRGVWLAMCIELCVRGALFLIRLFVPSKRQNERKNGDKKNIKK